MKNLEGKEVCYAQVCRAKVLPLLFQISHLISTSGDLGKSLEILLKIMETHLGVIRGMVNLYHRRTGKIFIHQSLGLTSEEAAKGVYGLGEGITGKVVEVGKTVVVPRISQEKDFLNRTGAPLAPGTELSFISVPIKRGKKILGALSAERVFDSAAKLDQDVELLSIVAVLIAQEVELYLNETEAQARLAEENRQAQQDFEKKLYSGSIIGHSKPMREVFSLIKKISKTRTTVLILGESGVGKELVASAIHYASDVASGPLVKFNCAALPESLVESELFGHEKGSFTGATGQRKGKFEEAHGGTIFLDEVGELTLPVQAKLLRVLQEKAFERVGGNKPVYVDIRIIAATNRNLSEMVAQGTFREDLYYRLNVFPILIPPLRDRGSDIITLADAFVEKFSKETGKNIKRISTPALDMLLSYPWPGNVRELQNIIERAVILTEDEVIHGYSLPPSLQTSVITDTGPKGHLDQALEALEYEMLVEALKNCNGNITAAGLELGLSKRMMGLRLEKYNIDYKKFRRESLGPIKNTAKKQFEN